MRCSAEPAAAPPAAAQQIRDHNARAAFSVAHNMMGFAPQRESNPLDGLLAKAAHTMFNRGVLEAFGTGRWKFLLPPATTIRGRRDELPAWLDAFGINFYSRLHMRFPGRKRVIGDFDYHDRSGHGLTDNGWEIAPHILGELIDEAAFNRDERLPYWADVWPSSIALAQAIRSMNGQGRSLLELGCGVGLVAAAALRAGFGVTASDYYEDALLFTQLNCRSNSAREPYTMLLDWRQLPSAIPAFDVIVGADVLYERLYGPVVARAIATTMAEAGRALIADPGRVGSPDFFSALHDVGLKHVGATVVAVPWNGRDHSITVHEVSH